MEVNYSNSLISIIIPIYNVEKYLPACLDSIIGQTHKDLEIILVNDGSTDNCRQICEEYAEKDKRIKVIHRENGGLSDARNAGLEIATGDFISFVDSDDMISSDFYEKLLNALLSNDADIAECGFLKFETEQELKILPETPVSKIELFEAEEALELLMKDYIQSMVWNKIFRKEIVIDSEFPKGKIHEDVFWTHQVIGNSRKIVKIHDILYFYRQQKNSIMGKRYSLHRLDAVEALEARIFYMKKYFPKLESLAIRVFCFTAMSHLRQLNEHPEIDPNESYRNEIKQWIRKYNKISVIKNWNLKTIFWFEFFYIAPNAYLRFRKKFNEIRNLE